MQALIFRFFDICLLRAGPQDLPSSLFLLRLVVALSIAVAVLLNLQGEGFAQALMIASFSIATLTGFIYFTLRFSNKLSRFRQTLIALLGTDVILGLLMLPFKYHLTGAELEGKTIPAIALQFILLLLVWQISVFAHIVRHSLEVRFGYGFVISFAYVVFSWTLFGVIFKS